MQWNTLEDEIAFYDGEINKLDQNYAFQRRLLQEIVANLRAKKDNIIETSGMPELLPPFKVGDLVETRGRYTWTGTIVAIKGRRAQVGLTFPSGSIIREANMANLRLVNVPTDDQPKEK